MEMRSLPESVPRTENSDTERNKKMRVLTLIEPIESLHSGEWRAVNWNGNISKQLDQMADFHAAQIGLATRSHLVMREDASNHFNKLRVALSSSHSLKCWYSLQIYARHIPRKIMLIEELIRILFTTSAIVANVSSCQPNQMAAELAVWFYDEIWAVASDLLWQRVSKHSDKPNDECALSCAHFIQWINPQFDGIMLMASLIAHFVIRSKFETVEFPLGLN